MNVPINLLKTNVQAWNEWREENPGADINLEGVNLEGLNLEGVNLASANLKGARLVKVRFYKANLASANLSESSFFESHINDSNLAGANLSKATLKYVDFEGSNLARATLEEATLDHIYCGANLANTSFKNASIEQFQFAPEDLDQLESANLAGLKLGSYVCILKANGEEVDVHHDLEALARVATATE